MDEMVKATQEWLNETYKGEKDFTPFAEKDIDGITGVGTFKRLIQALQIEINKQYGKNIKVDGDFGDGTLKALPATIGKSNTKNNIVHIIQSSLWCKGYSAGSMDGIYGDSTERAVRKFQEDAGIPESGKIQPYILQGIMNTDGYVYRGTKNTDSYYKHLVQRGMNKYYGSQIGLTAPNGVWERKSHKNLIKCCQIEWGLTPDGSFGTNTMNAAPTLSTKKSGYVASKRLLKWGLAINGYYLDDLDDGVYDQKTYNAVYNFQSFLEIGKPDGIAGKNTWASLLSSKGNTSRKTTACDTSTRLSKFTATDLKNNGYTDVGRYLTNTPGGTLDKKLTDEEIRILALVGMNIFPIFQTSGRKNTYFTKKQGYEDGYSARYAARKFGFPKGTVIYFAADYDVLTADIEKYIIPYFEGVRELLSEYYKVGVYGPRMLCNKLLEKGLTTNSFVSDMSSGFTGNIGQKMPSNWSYDQILETGSLSVAIDKCVASKRATAIPAELIKPMPSMNMENYAFFKKLYDEALKYMTENNKTTPSVYDVNLFVLQYLRGRNSYNGTMWSMVAGERNLDFDEAITYEKMEIGDNSKSGKIDLDKIKIFDNSAFVEIPMPHFAATLNCYLYDSVATQLHDERIVDSYTGWAGDLVQMCNTINNKDKSLFEEKDFYRYIAQEEGNLGFTMEDMLQDVDAFNMYNMYNWHSKKIYEIFYDYYYVSMHAYNRFTLFKHYLLGYFSEKKTIYDIAYIFTSGEYPMESMGFAAGGFGECPIKYEKEVAEAFAYRLDELIENE